ncbi:MAG TPA: hypothetical protein VJN42_10525 [Candidatus Acidoferrum sp.]|nr:hypothetical protein [Candidatus Acidoferrum sp.]
MPTVFSVAVAAREARVPELEGLRPISSLKNAFGTGDLTLPMRAKQVFSAIRQYRSLVTIVLLSALLRVLLVLRGGQYYWPDEGRILRTWVVLKLVLLKRPGEALDYLLHIEPFTPSHWFYLSATVLLLVVAQFAINIAVPFRQHFPPFLGPRDSHPLAWRPYQDEGFPPSVRAAFRRGDYGWWFARGAK